MLPKTSYHQTITSYSFQVRGDLPSHMGDFYHDADMSRADFEKARAAQISMPEQSRETAARDSNGWRTGGMQLPDPHPSFAAPNRKWREEGWFKKLNVREDGVAMTRAEFEAARATPKHTRSKPRNR